MDFKAKLKSKMSSLRSAQMGPGGEPPAAKFLTKIDRKFLEILGYNFGQGLPGVVEPFTQVRKCYCCLLFMYNLMMNHQTISALCK